MRRSFRAFLRRKPTWLARLVRSAPATVLVALLRSLDQVLGDLVAAVQLAFGREPSLPRTAWAAAEQWRFVLSRSRTAEPKGSLLVVGFRNREWVERAVYACCYLSTLGYTPVLLYSGQEIRQLYRGTHLTERLGMNFWRSSEAIDQVRRVDLDAFLSDTDPEASTYWSFACERAPLVAAYDLRVEEYEPSSEYERAVQNARAMLTRYADGIEHVLRMLEIPRVICPSGLIGWSVAAGEAARRLSIPTVFVEGWATRPGYMIWNLNRPAIDVDVEGWNAVLGEWDEQKQADIRDFLAFQERERLNRQEWLTDFRPVQRSKKGDPLPSGLLEFLARPGSTVLLATNVVGDSATLGRATIFRNQREWLAEVIRFFLAHPDLKLVVRAHPDEIWANARVRMGSIAKALAGNASNIYVLDAEEPVNTYAVAERCSVGLVWVSHIGVDMVLRGKQVLVAADAPYARLGVGLKPADRHEYFVRLLDLIRDPRQPDANMVTKGQMYHYIVFKLMGLRAAGVHHTTRELLLGRRGWSPVRHLFYRILAGEVPDKIGPPAHPRGLVVAGALTVRQTGPA